MDASETNYPPGDPRLIDKIVYQLKSQGIFDQFRKECMADVDTKPAYQNLHQRVEASVSTFLAGVEWKPDLSKNQLRENLRKHINESGFLEIGVERIVDQVVNPKIRTVFLPHVEEVVYSFLGLERPRQARTATNSSVPKPQVNDPPPFEETKPPEPKVAPLSDLLPHDLDPVSPDSDTCELTLKHDDNAADMDFLDGGVSHKDKKPEEDTSPAFEPLLDENSNGSHMSGMSGFSSHDEGLTSPMQQDVSGVAVVQDDSRVENAEKMEVETSCKSESESGADKVTSTVEENVQSPALALSRDMSALEIQEPSSDRLMEVKDEKCDSSMDRIEKDKDNEKEKDSKSKEKSDSKSGKSRSDSKDKYKSSDKSKHDSRDKKTEKDKPKHEESKSRSKSETRKERETGSKKDKVSDVKKDKSHDIKKDKKSESSKSEHRDGGSKKEKDVGSRKEKEHESKRDKDSDKKQDKDGDKKKEPDKDKLKSDDKSKSKHDDKTKDRSKMDSKHTSKEGKDKSQNKEDKYTKSSDKKSKSAGDQKTRDGEKKDNKEKSSSSAHKHSSDQKAIDDSEKKDKAKKGKSSDHAVHGDDKQSVDGDSRKSKDKSKKGGSRTKTPDDLHSTDGESDARSRDSFNRSKESTGKRLDEQVSSDGESDHTSKDSDKRFRSNKHKTPEKQRTDEDRSENGNGESSSKDDGKKRKERKSKKVQDDHHMHHSRRDQDRRSADRDSSGSAPPSGGSRSQRHGRSSRQESSPRKSSKTSDTNSSATDATESTQLHLDISSAETQDNEASPTSSLPFKKRPLMQDTESENNVNNNMSAHDKTALHPLDLQDKTVGEEEVIPEAAPKQVQKQKLGEVEKSLRSEVDASLANDMPSFDGKLNGMLRSSDEDEESEVRYFKSSDDSIFDDRDRKYVKALEMLRDDISSGDHELTICAVTQCFDDVVKTAGELGIKVVKTLKDIEVFNIRDEQETTNSFKDMLKNRQYMVRLSDDLKGFNDTEAPRQQEQQAEVIDLSSDETVLSADQNTNSDFASLDGSVDDAGAYRSTSDEDAGYEVSLSSDMIMPSLQDLMRESGMVPAPAPNANSQMGSCRRVGLPRPNRKSDSGDNSGGASFDKKNGMSNDRRLLRSSVDDSQRYSNDDLYKPRPLFSHGSRRNRHNSEEQASRPVAVITARPSARNVNFGAHDKLPCSNRGPCSDGVPRSAPASTLKATAEFSPRESTCHLRPPGPVAPSGQHMGGALSPQAGVNSKPSPRVARCTAATAMPPPLAVFLSLPRIQSRLLTCRPSRGGTRATQ